MSTPVPPVPPGIPSQVAEQQQGQQVAHTAAAQSDELRALAIEMQKPEFTFEACTFRKGIITAVADGPPPSVSLQISGDTATTISGVRRLEGYTPIVGQTVLILKQGSEIMALGHIAVSEETGWTLATLQSGFTHDGNNNGNLMYRKVRDHGADKIQWKGAVDRNTGSTVTNLPVGFRPASARSLVAARNDSGGSNVVRVDFWEGGDVNLFGLSAAPNMFDSMGSSTYDHPAHSHGGATGVTDPADGLANAHSHSISSTDFASHSHSHSLTVTASVSEPNWISFNGLEYFLDDD